MRYYNAWTCRFVSVDPLAGDYPFYTPYQYAGNKPINAIDMDGLEEDPVTDTGGQGQAATDNDNLQASEGGDGNVSSGSSSSNFHNFSILNTSLQRNH